MNKLLTLVKELLENGIPVSGVTLKDNELAYEIQIGSKTGTGLLSYDNTFDRCVLVTRYNQRDFIDTFYDISFVAFDWYTRYKDQYEPSEDWLKIWVADGKIQVEEKIVTTYKIK